MNGLFCKDIIFQARECILPLIKSIVYFMDNLREPLSFTKKFMINLEIADLKQAYDLQLDSIQA